MIAKLYQKTTYLSAAASVILCLSITLFPLFLVTTPPSSGWVYFEKISFSLGYMLLVFLLSFLDHKSGLLGLKAIHYLTFPLLLLLLPEFQYSLDQLYVFALFVFFANSYTKIAEEKERYKLLFLMTLVLTLASLYDLKYAFYFPLLLSLFGKRQFITGKHILAFLLPLVFTPLFVFSIIQLLKMESSFTFPTSVSMTAYFTTPIQVFWLCITLFSFLGLFKNKRGSYRGKTPYAFYFMLFIYFSSLFLLFIETDGTLEQSFLGMLVAAYFLGYLIENLAKEWIKDFLLITIFGLGIIIKLYYN